LDNDHGSVPLVVNTSLSFPHSRLITGFVTRLTRRLHYWSRNCLPFRSTWVHSPPVFTGVRVCFVVRCLSFCTFSFDHCVFRSSSIYGFWLPLWYLQTLLKDMLDYAQKNIYSFSIERPLNLPQHPDSNNYFSIPEENI
jgi:hypothetical protein